MEQLIKNAKNEIPPVDAILDEAWNTLKIKKGSIKNHFGEFVLSLDDEATKKYRIYEKKAIEYLAQSWLYFQKDDIKLRFEEIIKQEGWKQFIEKATKLFVEFGVIIQQLEKDLGNMRKARGGKTFEKMLVKLLCFMNIKCETPKGRLGEKLQRIDIVVPSIDVALHTPDRAFFITCKRTLRERWKQEVPQARLNQRIYLLTIDDNLSKNKAIEINNKGLIAFVRDDLFQKEDFINMPWIRKLSDFPEEIQ